MKALLPLLALCLCACRDEEISRRRVPKEAPAVAAPAAPSSERALRWTKPAGWKEERGSGMRLATLIPPKGKAEATVIALPGDVGGELANVNRWRGQIGLPPLDEKGLSGVRASEKSLVGAVAVYDFTSGDKKTRLIAGTISFEGRMWFVKLTGDAPAVAAARPAFVGLLRSLRATR